MKVETTVPENKNDVFRSIEPNEVFKVQTIGRGVYYVKSTYAPDVSRSGGEGYALNLATGDLDYFRAEAKVMKVASAKLVITD